MRVLVVDDDSDSRTIFRLALEARGYQVVEATDGNEAVRLAETDGPDVILMDMGVPGIDGWEATRRLKRELGTSRIPVVAVSAHAFPEHARRALDAGCCCYLTKPVDPHDLVAEVERQVQMV